MDALLLKDNYRVVYSVIPDLRNRLQDNAATEYHNIQGLQPNDVTCSEHNQQKTRQIKSFNN